MNAFRLVANALMYRPGAPWLLDLFCGAGGAAMGYWRAGFNVVGVDIKPQPHYPFWFIQADALEFAREYGGLFDAIHASPPCQRYSEMAHFAGLQRPRLITACRSVLEQTGKPYVIENVGGAARHMNAPVMLCGHSFGLKTYRHRFFEGSVMLFAPSHLDHPESCPCSGKGRKGGFITIVGDGGYGGGVTYRDAQDAMGIHWTNRRELSEAIPPAYTEWIGAQLMRVIPGGERDDHQN